MENHDIILVLRPQTVASGAKHNTQYQQSILALCFEVAFSSPNSSFGHLEVMPLTIWAERWFDSIEIDPKKPTALLGIDPLLAIIRNRPIMEKVW